MAEAWICDAVRTPIGRYGGALAAVRPDDMAADMLRALTARNPGFDPAEVGQVIFGCTNQAGEDSRDVARMAVLLAGMPETVPAITVNRLCASGLDAVAMAANAINAGEIDLAIAGGVESMTRAPFAMGKQGRPWARESLM
ncbi:MAG: acetyl-CoA C-acyltransferase, partial [Phycisphaerales bacterium]|nr:acetyl-CoA C-acyltransferase [Phycisphaerales bacterium]